MNRTRLAAWLWFLAGLAFVVAGFMIPNRQTSMFAVAVLDFAVAIVTLKRKPAPQKPTI